MEKIFNKKTILKIINKKRSILYQFRIDLFLFACHKQQKHNPVNLIEQYRNTIKINY